MNVIEAMLERRSVRNFNGEPLSKDKIELLQKAIDESYSVFGGHITIRLKQFGNQKEFRPSTYGFIKGACDYFLLGIGEGEESALTTGFQFEQVVLKAWQLGFGTCWIAGTFKGTDFGKGETWPEGESLKIVSPVGVAVKQGMLEKVARFTLGSQNRKPFDDLFFTDDFKSSLSEENKFAESLKMLRIAPSSTNSQPWRCLVRDNSVLFYCKQKSPVSIVDCGIGICHFYETEKFNGFDGSFKKEEEKNVPMAPENWKYLVTYNRM